MEVEHLVRTGSDHAPMLLTMEERVVRHRKSFKFLMFWTEHAQFTEVVRQNWFVDVSQNPFFLSKENIKRVKSALTK